MKKYTIIIGGRSCTIYTDNTPEFLLIQPADKHEIELLDKEIEHIKSLTNVPFAFAAFEISLLSYMPSPMSSKYPSLCPWASVPRS